jgi:hypothetical protein
LVAEVLVEQHRQLEQHVAFDRGVFAGDLVDRHAQHRRAALAEGLAGRREVAQRKARGLEAGVGFDRRRVRRQRRFGVARLVLVQLADAQRERGALGVGLHRLEPDRQHVRQLGVRTLGLVERRQDLGDALALRADRE